MVVQVRRFGTVLQKEKETWLLTLFPDGSSHVPACDKGSHCFAEAIHTNVSGICLVGWPPEVLSGKAAEPTVRGRRIVWSIGL